MARAPADPVQAAIAVLQSSFGNDAVALRNGLVTYLKDIHERGLIHAEERLLAERDGLACAHRLSATMDRIIAIAFGVVTQLLHPQPEGAGASPLASTLAIVAVGGYGRGTLAPGSDVDVLFMMSAPAKPKGALRSRPSQTPPAAQAGWGERVVEAVLYVLWDLKLKVGHATRTVDESIQEATNDLTIRTAILEARYLVGDRALFDELVTRFDKEIVSSTAPAFVEAKLAERDARLRRAGTSRYVVEPNVKDGKGGLRDLNTLFWIAKYAYRVRDAKELVAAGLFTQDEFALFQRCESFLWRVRCHMHFVTGRAEERLSFDLQPPIALRNGYIAHGGLSAVERFMKRYFLTAKDVGDLTAIVCAALEARHAKPRPVLDRFVSRLRSRRNYRALESRDFILDNNRITIADNEVFKRDPINLIRLYWLADRHSYAIHPDASRLATRSLTLIDRSVRNDPEANRLFLDVLTSHNTPEIVLRRMNESGVLGRFIPEFGRIVALMQFNMYHHYTVDEHLLRAVGVLADIDAGRADAEHPLSGEVIGTIQNRQALYVAVFLHDVAKGRQSDHSAGGARVARKLGPRFGLTPAETETAAWLVDNHLLMSMVAQSRDINDPSTIRSFAGTVQTMERLKLLLILTVCDIKAVGPGVWNGWKGELLRSLYYETQIALTGGHVSASRNERVSAAQAELREALPDWSGADFAAYAARHYAPYWLKVDLARKIQHAKLIRRAEETGETTVTAVETDGFRGVTELVAAAPDHPRLLAILTGACAAAGGNIVDAQIFTTTDGLALDTLVISRAFDRDDDELRRGERIAQAIKRALTGEVRIADLVASRRPKKDRSRTFHVPTEVIVDNSLSDRHTVLEISGLDRPGLLYDLTTVLSQLNLNIASAHIATYGEKVVDVFYVTDLTGAKIDNSNRQTTIRRAIERIFLEEQADVADSKTG
jgi:[protein-PII] uridylyltransferase